jgi:predicted DNA-binding transcriptional regulator YafY
VPPVRQPADLRSGQPRAELTRARTGLKVGVSFTQHRRIDRLRALLARHPGGVTLYELSQMLKVAPRTMRRYLKEIEREYELSPLRPRGGGPCLWRIHPSELPRKVEMRRAQAYALLATRRIFDSLQGSALFDEIDMAVSKLRAFADRPGRGPNAGLANARLEDRFVYLPRLARDYSDKSEDLDELFLAVAELRPLGLRYPRAGQTREERLTIHPYALVLHSDAVFCVGYHVEREEIRTFAFDRMRDMQAVADQRFDLPDNFRVEEHFSGEFGAPAPVEAIKVVVELDARAARSLRDARVHPSQKSAPIAGGGARLTLQVEDPSLLLGWVLGWGRSAEVVEPESFREQVQKELEAMLAAYDLSNARGLGKRKSS